MATSQTALLLGATGQVGQKILKELLSSQHFTKIGEFGRKVTVPESLPSQHKEKLVQKKIDFEKLEEAGLAKEKWDVVFISLGTTRKAAGSDAAFEKIDREYVVNAARAAKTNTGPQRLVYISSGSADPSSRFLYLRSKGLTELDLVGLGYADTIVLRPGILAGTNRSELRLGQSIGVFFAKLASHLVSIPLIQISTVAKSAVLAGKLGTSALPAAAQASKAGKEGEKFTLIENSGILSLSEEA